MERWFIFMGNRPVLFGIMAFFVALFFIVETKRSGKKVSPSELSLLVNNQNAKLIDVRAANKFKEGFIQGSENIAFADLPNHIARLKADPAPLIVICELGMQAGAAVALLGRDNVYRLDGGIQNWQASGMPLVTNNKTTKAAHSTNADTGVVRLKK